MQVQVEDPFKMDNIIPYYQGTGKIFTSKDELFNSEFFTEVRKNSEQQNEQFLRVDNTTSQGPCIFCRSENTFLEKKQTRSADEGITITIGCGNCCRSWLAK
jgi:DNA-directed RNA polymerase subunit M/transcription elongation factor TFIIS